MNESETPPDDGDPDYEVGYKKPPRHSQFQPGQSGNPGGRPKGSGSLSALVEKLGSQKVSVTENGVKKIMSKFEVLVSAQFSKASKGNVAAAKFLAGVKQGADQAETAGNSDPLGEEDDQVFREEVDWLAMAQKLKQESEND